MTAGDEPEDRRMTTTDLQTHRRRLLALAARLDDDVADLRGDALGTDPDVGDAGEWPAEFGDLASHATEQDVALSQLAS